MLPAARARVPEATRSLSVPDLEPLEPFGILGDRLDVGNGGPARPRAAPLHHGLDGVRGALEHRLDPPVREVADPPAKASAPGPLAGLVPEEDSLDHAGDIDMCPTELDHLRSVAGRRSYTPNRAGDSLGSAVFVGAGWGMKMRTAIPFGKEHHMATSLAGRPFRYRMAAVGAAATLTFLGQL